jgi:hypothetical protein
MEALKCFGLGFLCLAAWAGVWLAYRRLTHSQEYEIDPLKHEEQDESELEEKW